MGFLDKAKDLAKQAETSLNSATSGVGAGQQTKVADTWLKELGQWVYAERMGRDPRAAAEIEVRITQLQQWEQQNGTQVALPYPSPGTAGAPAAPGVPAAPDPGPAPIPSAAPAAPPAPAAPIPSAPAPGAAPPPPPPPPPPPAPAPPAPPAGPPPDLPGPPSGPPPGLPGPPV